MKFKTVPKIRRLVSGALTLVTMLAMVGCTTPEDRTSYMNERWQGCIPGPNGLSQPVDLTHSVAFQDSKVNGDYTAMKTVCLPVFAAAGLTYGIAGATGQLADHVSVNSSATIFGSSGGGGGGGAFIPVLPPAK